MYPVDLSFPHSAMQRNERTLEPYYNYLARIPQPQTSIKVRLDERFPFRWLNKKYFFFIVFVTF